MKCLLKVKKIAKVERRVAVDNVASGPQSVELQCGGVV